LGTLEAALNQFSGKRFIFPAGLFKGFSSATAKIKKMTKLTIKIQIPVTPARAMNFNFSILETRVGGVSAKATISTINHPCV